MINSAEDALFKSTGKKLAAKIFKPLVLSTINNLSNCSTVEALTGPIARVGLETVRKNLEALKKGNLKIKKIYETLGLITVDFASYNRILKNNK